MIHCPSSIDNQTLFSCRDNQKTDTLVTDNLHQSNLNVWKYLIELDKLGTPGRSNIDEFLEKFQTAFGPPPPALFWEKCCDFFQNFDDQHWICNEIFWIGNDPPPISKFFRKFMTKSAVSNAKKIATKFFGSEMTPPPLWNFSKNSSIFDRPGVP